MNTQKDERTARESLLYLLTSKIRILTAEQISRTFFEATKNPRRNATRLVRELASSGLVERFQAIAHPELEVDEPLLRWSPSQTAEPDFGAIAETTRKRWSLSPVSTELVVATTRGRQLFGGYLGGKRPRTSEISHDVHVATVLLQFLADPSKNGQRRFKGWIHEDERHAIRRSRHEKLPDAEIRIRGNVLVIEIVGRRYGKEKLVEFHEAVCDRPYELW